MTPDDPDSDGPDNKATAFALKHARFINARSSSGAGKRPSAFPKPFDIAGILTSDQGGLVLLRFVGRSSMVRAKWNGDIVAESDHTVVAEGNHYFPRSDVRMDLLKENPRTTSCPWKGIANYYDVVAGGETNPAAAWYYPDPQPAAEEVKDRIAFWKGVEVS